MHPQYDLFKQWTVAKRSVLETMLENRHILLGERLYAKHSVQYRNLRHCGHDRADPPHSADLRRFMALCLISVGESKTAMKIQKNAARESCELIISGRVDGDGANSLDEEILAILYKTKPGENAPKTVYVNLAAATFLSSAGLRALMQHSRTMRKQGGELLVVSPSFEASEVLQMAGVYDQLVEKHA